MMPKQDMQAFEVFYLDARDRCFRAVVAAVGDVAEAEDLVAEAFTRAFARWSALADHPSPDAWVTLTAVNLQRDRWRRRRHRSKLPAPATVAEDGEAFDPWLLEAIRRLPERQRQVVALRVLLGLSAEQTGAELGIDPGTVGTHLRRALAAIREAITPSTRRSQHDEPATQRRRRGRAPQRQLQHAPLRPRHR